MITYGKDNTIYKGLFNILPVNCFCMGNYIVEKKLKCTTKTLILLVKLWLILLLSRAVRTLEEVGVEGVEEDERGEWRGREVTEPHTRRQHEHRPFSGQVQPTLHNTPNCYATQHFMWTNNLACHTSCLHFLQWRIINEMCGLYIYLPKQI